jgi:hypothetical protein
MRLRPVWCAALLAAFLNVLAPVLAYAIVSPAHQHTHHAGMHHEPATPHCQYCLDFAAGAALGASVPVVPAAQPGHPPLPRSDPPRVSARPSLRLAPPRGPPLAA